MELIHRKSSEEKEFEEKLKELCGGFLPNDAFLERAEKFGLKNEVSTFYNEILLKLTLKNTKKTKILIFFAYLLF